LDSEIRDRFVTGLGVAVAVTIALLLLEKLAVRLALKLSVRYHRRRLSAIADQECLSDAFNNCLVFLSYVGLLVYAVFMIVTATAPPDFWGAALSVLFALMAVGCVHRAVRAPLRGVLVSDEGVTVRSAGSTRTFPWSAIADVQLECLGESEAGPDWWFARLRLSDDRKIGLPLGTTAVWTETGRSQRRLERLGARIARIDAQLHAHV